VLQPERFTCPCAFLACPAEQPLFAPVHLPYSSVYLLQALEQNYLTYKALTVGGAAGQQQQQQQQADDRIAVLGDVAVGSSSAHTCADVDMSDDSDADVSDGDDDGMAVDGGGGGGGSGAGSSRRVRNRASAEFRELVLSVLSAGGYESMRPAKMTQEDFLKLLADFNAAGIHFS
jgi:18S rRNA (adenine1779-N6/adenine1780-N6)-dimethyltransferase